MDSPARGDGRAASTSRGYYRHLLGFRCSSTRFPGACAPGYARPPLTGLATASLVMRDLDADLQTRAVQCDPSSTLMAPLAVPSETRW